MADDDLLLDASDLADIFGAEEETKSGEDLAKTISDLFLSDEPDEEGDGGPLSVGDEEAAPAPVAAAVRAPAPRPVVEELPPDEPTPQEPDRGGMTEEEWRASPQYEEFKKQVIARHLRQKALEEARRQKAELEEIQRKAEAERLAAEQASAEAEAEAARKKQALLDKYKAAKAATIAQRVQAIVQSGDQAQSQAQAEDAAKQEKLKSYLADLKAKVAAGTLPQMALQAKQLAPRLTEASHGLELDTVKARALAAMFEETRTELLKHVVDVIGKKPAQAMMKKTLAKVAKAHLDIYGRAAVDPKNELRVDGQLDEEKLTRAILAVDGAKRLAKVQKALYDLIEMRFIACELGLGVRQKGAILTRTLNALEASFSRKGHPADLVKWYMSDVIPSTNLSDSDEY